MARQIRYSRWRRLPGLHRITERKVPDHRSESQRLTLYLPGSALDAAEILAARAGSASVQEYCENLLLRAVEAEAIREQERRLEVARAPLDGLDEIANDMDYLAEWSARTRPALGRAAPPALEGGANDVAENDESHPTPVDESRPADAGAPAEVRAADGGVASIVLRHAAAGTEDAVAFLPTLRRGEPIPPASASELMQALIDLERELRGDRALDRRLAYALHRLAFEGQVLLTDAWPSLASDQATVDVLRMVQEAVDRVLSGEDIRYFAGPSRPEGSP